MSFININFIVIYGVVSVFVSTVSVGIFTPCKVGDDICATRSANIALPQFVEGIPESGVEILDPMHIDIIEGDLSILKYIFTNVTVIGYKNCIVNDVKLNMDKLTVFTVVSCPKLNLYGEYEINGRVIILPVEGKGKFKIVVDNLKMKLDLKLKKIHGQDRKQYLHIQTFKLNSTTEDGLKFDFENLFNGQKVLADAVLNFANENWKEVADLMREPINKAGTRKCIHNVNKYLKTVPLEELFLP